MRILSAGVAVATALLTVPVHAIDISWDGGASTASWQDVSNWDPDQVPNDSDIVSIGDLPAAANAVVELNDSGFSQRLTVSNGVRLDTNLSRLFVRGNLFVRSANTHVVVRESSVPTIDVALEAYNVLIRDGASLDLAPTSEDELVQVTVSTPGAGAGSAGEIDVEANANLLSAGSSIVRFQDGLDGGTATQLNNNGTILVTQPAAPAPGTTYTMRIESLDSGTVVDLDGDNNTGTIDLQDFGFLDIATDASPYASVIDLADRSQLRFTKGIAFADGATLNFNGSGGGTFSNRLQTAAEQTVTAESGSTFNVNAGTTRFDTQVIGQAGSLFQVADGARLVLADESSLSGNLALGLGSNLDIEGDVTLNETAFDWDGSSENAGTLITAGGRLTINADSIDSDNTHNGQIEVIAGATPAEGASLLTNVAQDWTIAGTLRVVGALSNAASSTATSTGTFVNGVDNTVTVDPAGIVELHGGRVTSSTDGSIRNEGTVQGNGLIDADGFVNNGLIQAVADENGAALLTSFAENFDLDGDDAVNPGGVEAIDGDFVVQGRLADNFGGTATVGSGRTIDFQVGWILGNPATLNLNGGAEPATVDSTGIDNGGSNQQNGITTIRGTVNVFNTGRILGDTEIRSSARINLMDNFGNLELGGATTIQAGATFSPDGQVVNLPGGVMSTEEGVDFGYVALVNEGRLEVDGDLTGVHFTQESGGEVVLEIGGTLASEYDQLDFDYFQVVGGTVTVEFVNGFSASDGDAFSLLVGMVGPGRFDDFQLPELAEGLSWYVDYFENELVISVEADFPEVPGDYNGDGLINAADYTVWRDTLDSTTELGADGDGDGVIDQDDYDLWSANYGDVSGPPASIPEPAGFLIAAGLTILGVCRHRV